ncbi:dynein light chain Tctex-type protein 2B isoform X2 [Musca autumnalis]|uniref:dynein light chain Tctex-type protein 2B isoform X2 n=1 Tax=Musca autumnalis TaxID=221902 RepID=UPI003CF382C7
MNDGNTNRQSIANTNEGWNTQISKFALLAVTTKPSVRYMPTYRLEAMRPLNKEVCENIMKAVMEETFENFTYTPKASLQFCAQISEEIKCRIKAKNYDRYRLIVIVTIGEKLMQGYYSYVNFLWDADKDGYLSYVIETPKFFAVATLYYLYYD